MQGPRPDSRIVYIDGAFDLFHAGHVEVKMGLLPRRSPTPPKKNMYKENHTICLGCLCFFFTFLIFARKQIERTTSEA
jgi:hypothetical protein